ncbi:copper resistance protein CopC [Quadrisphaera setariae]|uniref:Copper resistance protein CopC n=1 Tax=Quadrisphaera setariae TaxID=2593304 RepID=A0A5C8ZIN8_9ACTN|nr:copper resistance protein CopC [Quadrisphaera setariae]
MITNRPLSLEATPAAPSGAPVSFPSPARGLAVLGAAAALTCSSLLVAPAALAHDSLVSSVPGDGTTVTSAPESVSLGFSEAPLELGAQVVVTAPDGRVVTTGSPTVVGNDVVQGLAPDRPAGSYTVDWRVTSSDGHPIEGRVAFVAEGGVGASPTASSSAPSPSSSSSAPSPSATEAAASPSTEPASAQDDDGSGISGATWGWTIAAGAAGAAMGVLLVRARGRSGRA